MKDHVAELFKSFHALDEARQIICCLGLAEHFVPVADVISDTEVFAVTLRTLWNSALGFDSQVSMEELVGSYPDIDPDDEYRLEDDVVVTTGLMLEQIQDR